MTEMTVRIVISILLFILIIIILSKFRRKSEENGPADSLAILQERLEKGEITDDEYEDAKKRRGK